MRATPDIASILSDVALAAKAFWGYPRRWLIHWRDDLTLTPDFIRKHPVYAAMTSGEVAGFYAIAGQDTRWALEHFWVRPQSMGQGIGPALFDHAVWQLRTMQAELLLIESDPNAEGFYRHMGARQIGLVIHRLEGQPRMLPLLIFDVQQSE
ncbi:MAG: GNAT family N-acetyltransferase [Chloroflexota bacterium]|nr:GNAT family N-acetyltransferase [Chloroflexota bacterium]